MTKDGLAWVEALLSRWGRWSIRCESGALGFASSCILAGSGDGDGFDSAIPRGVIDDDMEAIDGAVRTLPSVLRLAVIEYYQHGAGQSLRQVAVRMGISYKTLQQYLGTAQRKIALDISLQCSQNPLQSANGGIAPERKQPALA
jgi:predicted DNA-binding protein (UPF0251 family)